MTAGDVRARATYQLPDGTLVLELSSPDALAAVLAARGAEGSLPGARLVQLDVEGADGRPVPVAPILDALPG